MKIKATLYLILLVYIFSCNTEKNADLPKYKIDLRKGLDNREQQFVLSDFVRDLEFVPLETSQECLLSDIYELKVTNDFILISDRKKLLKFGKDGRFIQRIGRTGKGPSEHGRNIKFNVNEHTNEAYILSNRYQVNVYDLQSGAFKRDFTLPFITSRFDFIPDNKCLFFTMEFSPKLDSTITEIFVTDSAGVKIDSVPDFNRLKNNNNVAGSVMLQRNNGFLNYKGHWKDTLYRINNNLEKQSYIAFDCNNDVSWYDLNVEPEMNGKLDNFIAVSTVLEEKNNLYLTLQMGIPSAGEERVFKNMLFNKNAKELSPTNGIRDDIHSGIIFWPKFIVDDVVIDHFSAYELMENYEQLKNEFDFSDEFKRIAGKLNENDNAILMIGKLR